MNRCFLTAIAIALFALTSGANADIVQITALDLRGTGVFGHTGATLTSGPGNTTADPLDWVLSYAGLDIDNDTTANDVVNFTVRASGGTGQRAWGQGVDTGFGSLNGVTFSVINVSGTATDSGDSIVFDGFTGSGVALGGNGDFQRNVDVNGTTINLTTANTGSFEFIQSTIDYAPTSSVLFDNSGGNGGSIVARHHDLQFSTVAVPEPSSLALLGLVSGVLALRRRK